MPKGSPLQSPAAFVSVPNLPPEYFSGWWGQSTPLRNMEVNWDDELANIWKNTSHVPNHQPVFLNQQLSQLNHDLNWILAMIFHRVK